MPELTFGQKLMILRRNEKLSQKKLAKLLNAGVVNIARYETETAFPNVQTLIKIADFFDVSIDYLLRNDQNFVNIKDRELLKLASQSDQLSDIEKNKLKNLIKSYLADNQI